LGEGGLRENPLFGGGFGGQLGVEEVEAQWQMVVSKRRLKYQLGSVLMALSGSPVPGASTKTGLLERAAPAQKADVQKLISGVQGLLAALDANVATQEELIQRVSTSLSPLEAIAGVHSGSDNLAPGPGGPAAPAAGGPEAPAVPSVPGVTEEPAAPAAPGPGGPDVPAPAPDAPGPDAPAPGPGDLGPGAPGAPAPGPGI
jgi:hypothetical protein